MSNLGFVKYRFGFVVGFFVTILTITYDMTIAIPALGRYYNINFVSTAK